MKNVTPIAFDNAEVAEKYTTTWSIDQEIHVCGHYRGRLSKITMPAADAAVRQGVNWIAEKQAGKPKNKNENAGA